MSMNNVQKDYYTILSSLIIKRSSNSKEHSVFLWFCVIVFRKRQWRAKRLDMGVLSLYPPFRTISYSSITRYISNPVFSSDSQTSEFHLLLAANSNITIATIISIIL